MKWFIIGIGAAVATAAITLGISALYRRRLQNNTDDIDGGVVKSFNQDVPKTVESTEIVNFKCKISLLATPETEGLGHRVYTLSATLKDGEVLVRYDWHGRGNGDKGEYIANTEFLEKLHNIVSKYDLAQFNGFYHSVSGLPDMYGCVIDVKYASGESIYASDNQSRFISVEAAKELVGLFGAATKTEKE